MQGYRVNDEDARAMVRWLKLNHSENANLEFARELLINIKLSYRQTGWTNPDKLEDYYKDYLVKIQNGKISEE